MARRGPVPKENPSGHRRGPGPRAQTKSDAQPDLPDDREWTPEALEWWQALGDAPEAENYSRVDWLTLRLVARLVDDFVREPSRQLLAELRLQLSKFGLSPEDRARLRLQPPKTPQEPRASGRSRGRPDPRLAP